MARQLLKSPSSSNLYAGVKFAGGMQGRIAVLALLAALCAGCREFVPYAPQTSVTGYAVQGKVVVPDGIPVNKASVAVAFNYDLVSLVPMDTTYVFVGNPPLTLFVRVFTPSGKLVRTIYAGRPSPGLYFRFPWDERSDSGQYASAGLYLIKYIYNNDTVKSVPYLIDDHLTATTDVNGDFSLGPQSLPVGTAFDIYEDTTYIGTYAVDPAVDLVFSAANLQQVYETDLLPNQLFQALFVLQ